MALITYPRGYPLLTLNEDEVADYIAISKLRNTKNPGVKSKRFDPSKTDLQIHIEGAGPEKAVSLYLGIPMNREMYPDGGDRQKRPDTIYRGWRGEVRGATIPPPHLKFNSLKEWNKLDFAVNVLIISYKKFEIWGWITREEFLSNWEDSNYGYGGRYAIKDRNKFRPMDQLKNIAIKPGYNSPPISSITPQKDPEYFDDTDSETEKLWSLNEYERILKEIQNLGYEV